MQKNNFPSIILKRLASDILMLLLIAWAPWWIIIIAAVAFLFVYNSYYEIVLWGLCLDEIYGTSHHIPYSLIATVVACLLFIAVYFLKKRLMIYRSA